MLYCSKVCGRSVASVASVTCVRGVVSVASVESVTRVEPVALVSPKNSTLSASLEGFV